MKTSLEGFYDLTQNTRDYNHKMHAMDETSFDVSFAISSCNR